MPDKHKPIATQAGTSAGEQCIYMLNDFQKEFEKVIASSAQVLVQDDNKVGLFVAERIIRFSYTVQRQYSAIFTSATSDEIKTLSALILVRFGSRESLPWLLDVAAAPGPQQYFVTRQLALFRIAEVRSTVLAQLRATPLSSDGIISGLLESLHALNESLPQDLLQRFSDGPLGVQVSLKSLGFLAQQT